MKRTIYALIVFVPGLTLAQSMSTVTIVPFLNKVNQFVLNPILELLFALSFLYFIFGIVKFLSADVGGKPREEARSAIIWGIVGMVIMFSVYGIIHFVIATFGISSSDISPGAQGFIKY